MRVLSRGEWMFLVAILVFSFVPTFGGLLRLVELLGGSAVVPENPRALAQPLPVVLHIVSSFVFCLLGAVQFVPSLRRRYLSLHRISGRAVAAAGSLSALTGLWMTHVYAFPAELQGALLYSVRMVLGVLMIGLIMWAVVAVRSGDVLRHSSAMLRAYAIGQGASTQVFLGIGWIAVVGSEAIGPWRDMMMVSAWCINLVVAEVLVGRASVSRAPALRL